LVYVCVCVGGGGMIWLGLTMGTMGRSKQGECLEQQVHYVTRACNVMCSQNDGFEVAVILLVQPAQSAVMQKLVLS
jgi:hypothetical protein